GDVDLLDRAVIGDAQRARAGGGFVDQGAGVGVQHRQLARLLVGDEQAATFGIDGDVDGGIAVRRPFADRLAGGQVDGGDFIAAHARDVEAVGRRIQSRAGQGADRDRNGPLDLIRRAVDDPDQVRLGGVARLPADDADVDLVVRLIDDDLADVSAFFVAVADGGDDFARAGVDGRDRAGAGVGAVQDLGAGVQVQAVERIGRDVDRGL